MPAKTTSRDIAHLRGERKQKPSGNGTAHIGANGHSGNGKAALGQTKRVRLGQKAKVKLRKARILRDAIEAPDVAAIAEKMIGTEVWRLRSAQNVKVLYLFVHAEKIAGGCLEGIVKAQRYPRLMRWKAGLKFEILVLVSKPRWDRTTDEEKTRTVFHALKHFWTDTNNAIRMQQHDFSGFYQEVEHFGLKVPDIKKIAEQLELAGLR